MTQTLADDAAQIATAPIEIQAGPSALGTTDIPAEPSANAVGTLPPLPDLFGNPMLRDGLIEIQPAATIDWMPQTTGWYLLAGLIAVWCGRKLWVLARRWLRNRYRREALRRLAALPNPKDPVAINEVLKLTAIVASTRKEVAGLSGANWLAWLESRIIAPNQSEHGPSKQPPVVQRIGTGDAEPYTAIVSQAQSSFFSAQTRALISAGIYQTSDNAQSDTLLQEARQWIVQHRDDHAPY